MHSIKLGAKPPALEPWGTVADLGATIIEGDVLVFGLTHHGDEHTPVSAGYFACTKGKFDMTYPFDEHATVIDGECTLTRRDTGQSVHYKAGDSWFIEKGAPISWHILSDTFTKHYLAVA
jgi:uncharacterized cupin superfamily protein